TPIMCVGETLEQREAGGTELKCSGQVQAGLAGVSREHVGAMVIAYEPIWAIGIGRTATPNDAQATTAAIRAKVLSTHGDAAAGSLRIQYGGSVKAANAAELMAEPDVDGALVGGASLDPDEFARIVRYREG
ncbi:MAG: triosephosphate isomerase, partial [Acidimicrobiia bacterium]|nr:triosephosphate isomerase [Acidimicrobiia bacterium]